MGCYKHIDTSPHFIAVDLERQLLPSTLAVQPLRITSMSFDSCKISRETFNGRSAESTMPRTKRRYAVEALLPGAQHREAGASRVYAVGRRRSEARVGADNTARQKSDH